MHLQRHILVEKFVMIFAGRQISASMRGQTYGNKKKPKRDAFDFEIEI